MKKVILLASALIGTFALAQTQEQRDEITRNYDKTKLKQLETEFQAKYEKEQLKITAYLSANPDAKKTFMKDGNAYFLQRIDAEGNPVYINTKDTDQVNNSKANALYTGGSLGVNITGTGMVAGVWDGGQVNASHELLTGNVTMQPSQAVNTPGGNNHMQAVSGIMVGKIITSSSNPLAATARGIAPNATTRNYDWNNDITEMTAFAADGFLISNHSYGEANTDTVNLWNYGAYNDTAEQWDTLLKTTPNYLPFVAAGNEQISSGNSATGGFDIITGSSASKNVMTVGAINDDGSMTDYSNWGPTDDGRVKPDIVTVGSNINAPLYSVNNDYTGHVSASSGTSYSAPAAAAAGLLLQQYYFSIFNKYMTAASLKALMLHTADDAGNPGPDAKFGWGILNVERAAKTIKQFQNGGSAILKEFTTNSPNEIEQNLSFKSGGDGIRASICWTDDEGTEQTAADGVNNTSTRLVYNFELLMRQWSPFKDSRPYKKLSVTNPNAIVTTSTDWWQNDVDTYKQTNQTTSVDNTDIIIYTRKKLSSPQATTRPYTVLVTGKKIVNSTLALEQNEKNASIVFYHKEEGKIKMISNNTKEGFGDFKIYDISGKLLKTGTEKGNTISFQNDNKGVYILIYQKNKEEKSFKFKN